MRRDIEKNQIQRLMLAIQGSAVAELLGTSDQPVLKDKKQLDDANALLDAKMRNYLVLSHELDQAHRKLDELEARRDAENAKNTSLTDPKRLSDMARRLDDVIEGLKPEQPSAGESPKERSRTQEILRGLQGLLKAFEDTGNEKEK